MQQSALKGATLVVTRPSASGAAIKRRILALGGNVLALPAIGLRKTTDDEAARAALTAARAADLVIFSSPTAVRFAFALQPRLRFARVTQVAAIGASTARALLRLGIARVSWPQTRHDSEALLAMPELQRLRGARVVLVGAPGGRDLLPSTLRARGAHVSFAHVYERTLPRLDRRHFLRAEQAAGPLITLLSSTQALSNLHAALPEPLFARLSAQDCVVSSARLAIAAQSAGFARVHLARSAMTDALIDTACTALAHHRL